MSKIARSSIDQLLARIDIVDLIGAHIPLKKKGSNHQACCPFHQEKSPSFSVSQTKQFYHCFGCGAHGNAIDFLMEYERVSFVEAVEQLAQRCGMTLETDDNTTPSKSRKKPPEGENQGLYQCLNEASRYFQFQLKQHPIAIDYFKKRGLSGTTAKAFGLGFAPDSWDGLLKTLGTKPSDQKSLLEAGLLIRNEKNRLYDRFRKRVMFPIRDTKGRVIGFGGRVIDPNDSPKYLNSPETPVFQKGENLYGLYEMRQKLPKPQQILVVEGYMDVVGLAEQGIYYGVATLGTATTVHHIRLLLRQTPNIIFAFDGDTAGRNAAWRALKSVLPTLRDESHVRFLFLPDGEDPDSLVQKEGKASFEARLQEALPLTQFLLQGLTHKLKLSLLEDRVQFLSTLKPLWEAIPDGLYRSVLAAEISNLLKLSEAEWQKHLQSGELSKAPQPPAENPQKRLSLCEQAILHLIQHPNLAQDLSELPELNEDPEVPLLKAVQRFLKQYQFAHTGSFLEHWPDENSRPLLANLASLDHPIHQGDVAGELQDIFSKLQHQAKQAKVDVLLQKSKQTTLSSEEKALLNKLLKSKLSK